MPLGYILFGCILIIYSFTFLKGRTCLVLGKGRNSTSVLKHLPPLLLPPLLDLLCLNIFVRIAKSLKHLLPPPLLLRSRMYLAKTWNDYPHQKPILPSFGLTPSEHLSQHKEASGLQFLVIPIFFASPCFLFHCTGLWQFLKSSLTEHDLISHQFTFAVSDYPHISSIWSLLQVREFLVFFPPSQSLTTSWTSPSGSTAFFFTPFF